MAVAGGAPPLPVPGTDPSEVGRRADEILARPEFQPEPMGLVERGFDAVGDVLGGFLDTLFTGGGSALLAWMILVLVGGSVAYLVIRLGRTVQRSPEQEAATESTTAHLPADWLAQAERLESMGAWRDGLRCRYRALVGALIDRRLIADVPGRTSGEYRRDVADAAPAASGEFAGATELFELAWYGDRSTGPAESERFRALAERVLDEAAP